MVPRPGPAVIQDEACPTAWFPAPGFIMNRLGLQAGPSAALGLAGLGPHYGAQRPSDPRINLQAASLHPPALPSPAFSWGSSYHPPKPRTGCGWPWTCPFCVTSTLSCLPIVRGRRCSPQGAARGRGWREGSPGPRPTALPGSPAGTWELGWTVFGLKPAEELPMARPSFPTGATVPGRRPSSGPGHVWS